MTKIRNDSTTVEIYNEGLMVFLYDEANIKTIQKAAPSILSGFGEDSIADPALAKLARRGALVAYELVQDDEFAIEVIVGPLLTNKELGKGNWLPVQRAPISLPSGKLCIESYNNLRLSPDYDPKEEPGVVISVAKGDYVLSLYRFDWNAGKNWRGASEVIVLTKAGDADPVTDPAPLLRILQEVEPAGFWVGEYTIKGKCFRGLAQFSKDSDLLSTNLNPPAAKILRLKPGTVVSIKIQEPKIELKGVYAGENFDEARKVYNLIKDGSLKDIYPSDWMRDSSGLEDRDYLVFVGCGPSQISSNIDKKLKGKWVPSELALSTSILKSSPQKRSKRKNT